MHIEQLNNAVKINDVDLYDDQQCIQLGRVVADKCVVVLDQVIEEDRLYDIQTLWGAPSRALVHTFVSEKKLKGRHWRNVLVNLGYIGRAISDDKKEGLSRVSYELNEKGKPTGIFTNGELNWHSDQQAFNDSPRVIGLMSLWGTAGSQTTFLSTHQAYGNLNHEDRSIVDELVSVYAWDGGSAVKDLINDQKEIFKYHMVPVSGMESPLRDQTASGVQGIKFPSHSFSHFRGMSKKESLVYRDYLWTLLNKPEYIYTQDWKDGQIVFMDQNITLHARPTNVVYGSKRTMVRMCSYMDNLFPNCGLRDTVLYGGERIDFNVFAYMVNEQRINETNTNKSI